MPIIQSAKKALRQSRRRQSRNLKRKEAYKNAVKKYKKFVLAKKTSEAQKQLAQVFKSLDKAAKTNVIEKNKANRLKSRLAQSLTQS